MKVERETTVAADPEDVWEALTDETLLAEWLAPEVELDPTEGGEVFVRTEDGDERWGRVEEVEPGHRLAFTWGESRVELTVDAVSDGTRVRVVETAAIPVGGWGPKLTALASASTLALA
jgi:uncharacterized protein YndB with AHSA1/START domain